MSINLSRNPQTFDSSRLQCMISTVQDVYTSVLPCITLCIHCLPLQVWAHTRKAAPKMIDAVFIFLYIAYNTLAHVSVIKYIVHIDLAPAPSLFLSIEQVRTECMYIRTYMCTYVCKYVLYCAMCTILCIDVLILYTVPVHILYLYTYIFLHFII